MTKELLTKNKNFLDKSRLEFKKQYEEIKQLLDKLNISKKHIIYKRVNKFYNDIQNPEPIFSIFPHPIRYLKFLNNIRLMYKELGKLYMENN